MVVNRNVGPLAREGDRGGAADAAIGARYERCLPLELHSGPPKNVTRSMALDVPAARATRRLAQPCRRKNGAR
jgi:hypothetical protein